MYKNGLYVSCIKEMVSPSQCFYSHSTGVFGLVGTGTIATTTNNNITIINRGQVAGGHGHWSGNRSLMAWLMQQYATANQATATTMRGERQRRF